MTTVTVTGPAKEAVDLNTVKNFLRVPFDLTEDDARLLNLAESARQWVEQVTSRVLITQTLQDLHDDFPDDDREPIALRRAPVQSVDSITYIDEDGVTQTWDSSEWQSFERNGETWIQPIPDECYPDTEENRRNAVTIEYTAGDGDDWNGLEQPLRDALLYYIMLYYDALNPEMMNAVKAKIDTLIAPYRIRGWTG